jgi:hypothetical protein
MTCEGKFNLSTLTNYSFSAHTFSSSNINGNISSSQTTHQLYPFKQIVSNDTTASNNTIVIDYAIPVYTYYVKYERENGTLVKSPNRPADNEISCFNQLVRVLNAELMANLNQAAVEDFPHMFGIF